MANWQKAGASLSANAWLRYFLKIFAALSLLGAAALGWSCFWLYKSGDLALERAVEAQAAGEQAIFGSGVSQDFVEYKIRLYEAVKPQITALGSSRVMQFRGGWFTRPFVNMGGAAGNLSVLAATARAILAARAPRVVLLGLDFWWFLPQWEERPEKIFQPAHGSYGWSVGALKKPWGWLFGGRVSAGEFFAPLAGGFKYGRYGIMAQQTGDGFGPDGAWNYTAEITGQKPPFDFQFRDTLLQVARGIKAFYHAKGAQAGPAGGHIAVLLDLVAQLRAGGTHVFAFMPPLAPEVYAAMRERQNLYPHLFRLRAELAGKGLEVEDFSNPAVLGAEHCEFVDGFHGGEVVYARILLHLAKANAILAPYVNLPKLEEIVLRHSGLARVPGGMPEVDFMDFGCPKKRGKK